MVQHYFGVYHNVFNHRLPRPQGEVIPVNGGLLVHKNTPCTLERNAPIQLILRNMGEDMAMGAFNRLFLSIFHSLPGRPALLIPLFGVPWRQGSVEL